MLTEKDIQDYLESCDNTITNYKEIVNTEVNENTVFQKYWMYLWNYYYRILNNLSNKQYA